MSPPIFQPQSSYSKAIALYPKVQDGVYTTLVVGALFYRELVHFTNAFFGFIFLEPVIQLEITFNN